MLLRRLCLRQMSSSGINNSAHASNLGPLQQIIEQKINKELEPKFLQVFNDSHLHTGHVAMRGVQSKETHFRLTVVSERFRGKSSVQRHRLVYALLKDELESATIHALQLKTKTPEEE